MALPSKNFQQFVSDTAAAWAAILGFQPTLQPGDALLALMESVCAQMVFIQAQIQIVNNLTRAQTSTGADLDSWMAQFNFTRLPASFDTGSVTFTKLTAAASQVLIPVGLQVQTAGGAIVYTVVGDNSQPTWNPTFNAYVLAPGQTSLTATVQAVVAGTSSNVAIGQISQILGGSSSAGIDQVSNGAPITNALNAETDDAFRARFIGYINSLSKATYGAIVSAIQGVQQGLLFTLQENVDTGGNFRPGEFVATVDDGSGNPPVSLVNAVQTAINAVRGFTILAEAVAVNIINSVIFLAIRVDPTFVSVDVEEAVAAAVVAAVNNNPLGNSPLFISFINDTALTVPGCKGVQPGTTTIDGVAADKVFTEFQAVRTAIGSVTVGTY